MWYRVAARLNTPVAELKEQLTYGEFLEWVSFMEMEDDRTDRMHYYLAQVAAEVRRSYSDKPVSVEDMMLKFERPMTPYERMMHSKRTWAAHLGIEIPE